MSAMNPINPDASFTIEDDGETLALIWHDGTGDPWQIAWSAPPPEDYLREAVRDQFRWLASSAAAYHNVPLHTSTQEE